MAAAEIGQLDGMVRMAQEHLIFLANHHDHHFVRIQEFGGDALHVFLADGADARTELLPKFRVLGAASGEFRDVIGDCGMAEGECNAVQLFHGAANGQRFSGARAKPHAGLREI